MSLLNAAPHWPADDGLSNVNSDEFKNFFARAEAVAAALEGAAALASSEAKMPPGALTEMLGLYGRGLDLIRTMRTICRAHLGLNVSDTTAVSARSTVALLANRIDTAVEPFFAALHQLNADDPTLGGEEELHLWLRNQPVQDPLRKALCEPLKGFSDEVAASIINPIAALHAHLTSTMSVEAYGSDGRPRAQSFGACTAVLKNSDDPILRRTTFEGLNAWLAAHAASFLDVINALSGYRTVAVKHGFAGSMGNYLAEVMAVDRMNMAAYNAMFDALEDALTQVREAVTLRAGAYGSSRMKVWNLLAAPPAAFYAKERPMPQTAKDLLAAFKDRDPDFCAFLKHAYEDGWIDAQGISKKAGGAWVDDLPAADAVRILTNYLPTLAGVGAITHLLGAAFHMYVMHHAPAPARLTPISITEIAANFYETALFSHFAQTTIGTPDSYFFEWQSLRRITNCLLVLPARHRLLKNILQNRSEGALSLVKMNELSREAWQHYFGDSTDGEDRYVWAYKPHFYRTEPIFYDWQYTLGFLISIALSRIIDETGRTASGATLREAWLESGSLSVAEFGKRHLREDLTKRAFWESTIALALEPVRREKLRQQKNEYALSSADANLTLSCKLIPKKSVIGSGGVR